MKIIKEIFLLALLLAIGCNGTLANETTAEITTEVSEEIENKNPSKLELRRVDRDINEMKFIFRGEIITGFTASHYSLSGDNAEYLLLLNDITAEASMTTFKPYAAYFYRDNRAIGTRFGYSKLSGLIDSATLDLGDTNDVELDVPYVSITSKTFSYAIFHRSYAALDRRGTVGLFADVELEATSGNSNYNYEVDGAITSVHSETQSVNLSFNPGLAVFVTHNVSATLSFELGGFRYVHIDQYNGAGEWVGSRDSSKMRFNFNVLAVNFGINFHIW